MAKCVSIDEGRGFSPRMPEVATPQAVAPRRHWPAEETDESQKHLDRLLEKSRRKDAEEYGGKLPYRPWYADEYVGKIPKEQLWWDEDDPDAGH